MIPEYLHSDGDGKPFSHCKICENSLDGQDYVIEKSFGHYLGSKERYTIFECAMCLNCRNDMMQQISKESKAKIMEMAQQAQNEIQKYMDFENPENEPQICVHTQKELAQSESYQVVAMVTDGKLRFAPIAISSEFVEHFQEFLSKETKDFLDDFGKRITDLPPHLAKLLGKETRPIFI